MSNPWIKIAALGVMLFISIASYNFYCVSNPSPGPNVTVSEKGLMQKYELDKINLPPGFEISVFAEVPNARSMCRGDKGTIFVGNRSMDKVYALVDADNNGKADKLFVIAENMTMPCGVAFRNGSLFVATVSTIYRYDNIENNLNNPPKPVVVYEKYPNKTHHGWKFIAFGPDGKLYVPVGAPCNVCEESNPVFASITRINPDGTGMEVFAHGVRNTVGFDWHPQTKELWFTDNGRDLMGDDIPADELNHAPKKDMHFGFPYCHQGDLLDPDFGKGKKCSDYTPPAQKLGPHVAAIGMRFYTGKMFPAEYKNQILIAEHGSWNRSKKIGYRVTMATIKDNKVVSYKPFADGWLQPDEKVLGRPADILNLPDGSILVSDDFKGVVYRISYNAK